MGSLCRFSLPVRGIGSAQKPITMVYFVEDLKKLEKKHLSERRSLYIRENIYAHTGIDTHVFRFEYAGDGQWAISSKQVSLEGAIGLRELFPGNTPYHMGFSVKKGFDTGSPYTLHVPCGRYKGVMREGLPVAEIKWSFLGGPDNEPYLISAKVPLSAFPYRDEPVGIPSRWVDQIVEPPLGHTRIYGNGQGYPGKQVVFLPEKLKSHSGDWEHFLFSV